MKKEMPEKYRLKNHPLLGSDARLGANGFFVIPHYKIRNYFIQCQVSDGLGWEHVSISLIKQTSYRKEMVDRCPTWEEMCWIKDLFWDENECVIQYHPPKSDYISHHPYCLHLWKSTTFEMPVPDSIFVGPKSSLKSSQP